MRKAILGVVLGAAVHFAWGAVSWMVLPWHDTTIKKLPEEQLLTDTMRVVVKEPGLYFFPCDRTESGRMDPRVWEEKFRKGPTGLIAYSPGGKAPMGTSTFLFGFLGDLLAAALCMVILLSARDRVHAALPRVLLVMGVGFVAWASVHLPYWNWLGFPADYTVVALADMMIASGLMGAVLAVFVPRSP